MAKPHSRKKAAARDALAMSPDEEWADDLSERMLGDCHPFQRDAVLDPSTRVSILVGRGGGKTTAKRVRAVRKISRIRRARVAYVATSRPEAERLNWEPLKELIEQLGESDHFEFTESKMICRCKKTGGEVQFFGADDKREINKLRGQPFDEFQVDETASHDVLLLENMLDRAVGPRLGERHGCIVLGGTPGHVLRGRFYEATRNGSELHRAYRQRFEPDYADWINWSSHAWNMLDVLALPDAERKYQALALNWQEALVEKKRQGWSDDNPIWQREYLGRWAADNTTSMYAYAAHKEGRLFNRWEPFGARKLEGLPMLKAAIAALPRDMGDPMFGYGIDLGSRDPFALNIKAFSPTDPQRRFFHVFSFEKRRMYANEIAKLLIGEEAVATAMRGGVYSDLGGLFGVTGWPAAIVADLAGLGETLIDELANVYGIRIKAAEKKGKFGAIEVYNGHLVDGRMYILADTPLEQQLSMLQWKPDEYGQPKEDKAAANHSADSATYIITEIGTMFSGSMDEKKKPDASQPQSKQAKPPPSRDDWGNGPVRSRSAGEFDSLIGEGNFNHIGDGWGNQ
jgi:hypothetical protein